MEKGLSELRAQIDALDDELMALLRQRAELTSQAGKVKMQHQVRNFSRPEREAEILRRLSPHGGILPPAAVIAIYREIISAGLACEKLQTIGYLGPPHTFTHDAARKHFGESAEYAPAPTIGAAIGMAEKSLCDFVVVPFENSNEGTVGDTFAALLETPLTIGGEIMLRIRHHLLAAHEFSPAAATVIYAHPQALAQCRKWLERHAPQARMVAMESNAAAAAQVAEQGAAGGNIAAIASQLAGRHYQLKQLAADIEDSAFNTTRFLMLGTVHSSPSPADKTSLIMSAPDKAGALCQLIEPLARLKISMSKFESRPALGQLWEYVFFVDIDGHQQTPLVAQALAEIGERASFLKVLGSYPQAVD